MLNLARGLKLKRSVCSDIKGYNGKVNRENSVSLSRGLARAFRRRGNKEKAAAAWWVMFADFLSFVNRGEPAFRAEAERDPSFLGFRMFNRNVSSIMSIWVPTGW